MAKQAAHDIREYYILAAGIDVNPVATVAVVPIPFAAQVIRVAAVATVRADVSTGVNFQVAGLNLQRNGLTATLSLLSTDAIGTTRIREFSSIDPQNAALEGEDGDAIATGTSISIVSAGESTIATDYAFVFTLRP